MRFFSVGVGGILGALARYAISLLLNDKGMLPWGTFAVNVGGCFFIALFLTLVLHKLSGQSYFVLAVATGFIGSFTTFSTLSVEGIVLFQTSAPLALLYLGLTLLVGFIFTWFGYATGQYILTTGWGQRWTGLSVKGERNG
ncbi:fluoride efflux transporter FluC [Desulfoscipio geothermicus]|uniref:Fluoride-specific ion channel FluC n=1 Tax=Desulfoscipio geothermicus DSM 3669 TaxID=1121426 RepID=A0A1I6D1X9_9FIRM|nr:CrcB family protein [Desulfoscipio geothermicus]SFQ99342.1 CrcB protein [Desulfoscipio geothermicus DSM 3669]